MVGAVQFRHKTKTHMLIKDSSAPNGNLWFVDFGANMQFCNEKLLFTSLILTVYKVGIVNINKVLNIPSFKGIFTILRDENKRTFVVTTFPPRPSTQGFVPGPLKTGLSKVGTISILVGNVCDTIPGTRTLEEAERLH